MTYFREKFTPAQESWYDHPLAWIGAVLLAVSVFAALVVLAIWATTESSEHRSIRLDLERRLIEEKLPPLCNFIDLGKYDSVRIVVIRCGGKETISLNRTWTTSTGKTKMVHHSSTVVLRDLP